MVEQLKSNKKPVRTELRKVKGKLLSQKQIENYKPIIPANPKLRILLEKTVEKGMWKLLWMPPSMPYTEPIGEYKGLDELEKFTKLLVFSRWHAVPDAIATLSSYETERRMVSKKRVSYSKLTKNFSPPLDFEYKENVENPNQVENPTKVGMLTLSWMLPSLILANCADPLEIALRSDTKPLALGKMRAEIKKECRILLKSLRNKGDDKKIDKSWYWAAPFLLEKDTGLIDWCTCESGWLGIETSKGFRRHINKLHDIERMASREIPMGAQPPDLADVLADLVLAGPGVCALRTLRRVGDSDDYYNWGLCSAAAKISSGFRSLFSNVPEVVTMLKKGRSNERYIRDVMKYCIAGNLQSTLDEYGHVLKESLGIQGDSPDDRVTKIAKRIQSTVSMRTTGIHVNLVKSDERKFGFKEKFIRCRFAQRLGSKFFTESNEKEVVRVGAMRDAFNSPFRPFILATTSIGQEGLDFHTWCHSVMHWDLPHYPEDLEQREGRVHRYKGHAIRKNVVEFGLAKLSTPYNGNDPWDELFEIAYQKKSKSENQSDLVPYWIFDTGCDNSAKVERCIPKLSYSKDVGKLEWLKDALVLYRLVFGQARQEELLRHLRENKELIQDLTDWLISLQPPEIER